MSEENLLQWTDKVESLDEDFILLCGKSTGDMFWFEIKELFGEGKENYGYTLLAEGTALCDCETIAECQAKAQKIQNAIDGTDE